MEIGYLPSEHHHKLAGEVIPAMRWDGAEPLSLWQARARERLGALLGLPEIAKRAVKPAVELEFDRMAEDGDFREIRFRLSTEENVTVPCHLCIPKGATGPLPVVIALQGHSTGMHISLGRPKFPWDEESCHGGDRDFVARAVKEGVCAIAMEQRCFGENGGNPDTGEPQCTEPALRALLVGRTLLGERVWDVMRLIDVLGESFSKLVDPDRVICLGNSGGGTATVYASAMDERIKISVPSCAVCRYADSIAAMQHCACNYVPTIANFFDMGDLCAMISPRSLVVVNGKEDTIFPIGGARACVELGRLAYRAAGVENRISHVIGEGGHRFYADAAWPEIREALRKL